ncbi:cellulase family glycosylhydrolase [Halopiger goleimassiliensis]|uniref:cellulase family glycosylhydrolase n=1 Tax=Halopiger goleimassiliensis TaxID=1293048 RepID=UPI000677A6B7|nr:cellulase family glycosylhydrolase [Halopiger goleimassiliensis]
MVERRDSTPSRRPGRPETVQSTRRTFVKATGVGVAGLGFGPLTGTAAAVDNPTPRLHTDGKWIVTEDGQRVKLRGFATASLDYMQEWYFPKTQTEVLEQATDGETWHPNTIRLPVGEDAVHEQGMEYVVDELLRPAVDLLGDRGVYALIDFHLIRPYIDTLNQAEEMVEDGWANSLDGLGFNPWVDTDDLLEEFWSTVAPAFADDDHVLFELFNEPTLPVTWSEYGEYGDDVETEEDEWLYWRDAAQPWVDLIREEAPETPVVIGSPDWTSRTRFAAEYPFEGENLVYASHIYPPDGLPHDTREVADGTGGTYEAGPFDPEYGAPAEEVPVICTEFGWDPDLEEDDEGYGHTSSWGEPVREWLESYENMGWIAWCFDDTWAPTFFESPTDGADEPWELKDDSEQMGWFVRDWLEETRDDTFRDPNEPIPVGDYEAHDPDGDGLYDDVTGDGRTNHEDVEAFYEHLDADGVQKNPDAFDFDEDDNVSYADVLELLERL